MGGVSRTLLWGVGRSRRADLQQVQLGGQKLLRYLLVSESELEKGCQVLWMNWAP